MNTLVTFILIVLSKKNVEQQSSKTPSQRGELYISEGLTEETISGNYLPTNLLSLDLEQFARITQSFTTSDMSQDARDYSIKLELGKTRYLRYEENPSTGFTMILDDT